MRTPLLSRVLRLQRWASRKCRAETRRVPTVFRAEWPNAILVRFRPLGRGMLAFSIAALT